MVVLSICLLFSLKILPNAFIQDASGMPSVLWIAMGTDIDNNVRGPGWYDSSNYNIFQDSDSDPEVAKEKGIEKLINNVQKMLDRPLETSKFFVNKTVSQWCNPLYQSLWSGPLQDCNQYTYTKLLTSLYTGGIAEKVISNIIKVFMIAFFGLSFGFIIFCHKKYDGWELAFLMLIGGFLFHLFWEGKSQYVYPYFFALMPFAAFSASRIVMKCNLLKRTVKKSYKHKIAQTVGLGDFVAILFETS
jgi:hypothetical protein